MLWNRLFIVFCIFLMLASCSTNRQIYSPLNTPHRFCVSFNKPTWEPLYNPAYNTQQLIDKQKFAIQPEQHTLWFTSANNVIGLCVPPKINFRRSINDCGTVYVTYQQKDTEWEILEQKVTICPS